jgi:hypothetical protein
MSNVAPLARVAELNESVPLPLTVVAPEIEVLPVKARVAPPLKLSAPVPAQVVFVAFRLRVFSPQGPLPETFRVAMLISGLAVVVPIVPPVQFSWVLTLTWSEPPNVPALIFKVVKVTGLPVSRTSVPPEMLDARESVVRDAPLWKVVVPLLKEGARSAYEPDRETVGEVVEEPTLKPPTTGIPPSITKLPSMRLRVDVPENVTAL